MPKYKKLTPKGSSIKNLNPRLSSGTREILLKLRSHLQEQSRTGTNYQQEILAWLHEIATAENLRKAEK